jgi:hypothetical protein
MGLLVPLISSERTLHATGAVAQVTQELAASWVGVEHYTPEASSTPPRVEVRTRHSG